MTGEQYSNEHIKARLQKDIAILNKIGDAIDSPCPEEYLKMVDKTCAPFSIRCKGIVYQCAAYFTKRVPESELMIEIHQPGYPVRSATLRMRPFVNKLKAWAIGGCDVYPSSAKGSLEASCELALIAMLKDPGMVCNSTPDGNSYALIEMKVGKKAPYPLQARQNLFMQIARKVYATHKHAWYVTNILSKQPKQEEKAVAAIQQVQEEEVPVSMELGPTADEYDDMFPEPAVIVDPELEAQNA